MTRTRAGSPSGAAGRDDHPGVLEAAGELRAVDAVGAAAHSTFAWLGGDVEPGGGERRRRAAPARARPPPPGRRRARGRGAQRLERAGLGELVEAELRLELREQRLGAGAADGVAAAQPGQAPRLRERAEDEQPRVVGEQVERGVARLGVDEVAQRLVEQDDDALGQRLEQGGEVAGADELAGRVVRVAQRDEPRAVVDRAQDGVGPEAPGRGPRARASAAR